VAERVNMLSGKNLWKLPDGMHKDRRHLSLHVRNGGKSRAWAYRYTKPDGTYTEPKDNKGRINLGPLADIDLPTARNITKKYDGWLAQDKDPAVEQELEVAEDRKRAVTVAEVVDEFKANKLGKRRESTRNGADVYFRLIKEKIGKLPATSITRDILKEKLELRKMWHETHVKCQQLCSYLRRIFEIVQKDYHLAQNAGADLTIGFAPSKDVHKVNHHPEMSYTELPAFLKAVREYRIRKGFGKGTRPTSSLWCECVFLTAVRKDEIRLATWKDIDWKTKTWNVQPEHRKGGGLSEDVRPIPITPLVERVLREMEQRYPDAGPNDPVFPRPKPGPGGKLLRCAPDTLMKFIRWSLRWERRITSHTARNAFVSWAETHGYDNRLIQRQLDHMLAGDVNMQKQSARVRKAYHRDTLLEPRRKMMTERDRDLERAITKLGKQK
jgi:integrase